MSRSYRKQPFFSIYGNNRSEKEDKKLWHRAFRIAIKKSINYHLKKNNFDDYITPVPHDVMTIYDMAKEYRYYQVDADKKRFRK